MRMHNKKETKSNKKTLTSILSLILLLTAVVAITLAYKTDDTEEIVNEFDVPEIETPIEETFDGVTKTNVTATNSADSDVDVYVRLKFVVQTLEPVYDSNGNLVMQDADGNDIYVIYNDNGTIQGYSYSDNGEVNSDISNPTLTYKVGAIVATPSSYDEDGYLLNLPITIINALNIGGLNVDFTGDGNADWFTDANQETGIYFYKYSLAPGESAYDLITDIYQEVFYEDTILRLTVLVDSVQVDGVEDAWENVNQAIFETTTVDGELSFTSTTTYTDANGNPILYSATYEDGATGVIPKYNRVAVDAEEDVELDEDTNAYGYIQRFNDLNSTNDTYDTTLGEDSYGDELTMKYSTSTTDTTE